MKKVLVLTVLVFCVAFAGCSKDGEINAFITEFESVTQQMTKDFEAGNVDAAQKTFDSKKESLKASWDSIKGARGFQVSEESQKKLMDSVQKNISALTTASIKTAIGDADKAAKTKKLLEEYKNIFQM